MIDKILQWANQEPGIRALILSGSRADTSYVDELSDYDISIFCESVSHYSENSLWISKLGTVWVTIPETVFCNDKAFPTRLVIYEGGSKVDFSFFPTNLLQDIRNYKTLFEEYERGHQVLLDKDGLIQKLPEPLKKTSERPSEKEFQSIVREFWFEVYHVAKYLKREDLWLVKFRAGIVNEFLLKMIEWHAQALNNWKLTIPPNGKRMQSWVDADTWKTVHKIFGHFDKEDSWTSLDNAIGLFRQLAIATAKACNLRYPQEVDENISKFVYNLKS